MKKAKGSFLKFFVKAIRANKTGIYDDFLTDEDKKVISERIFDAAWYPFETYKRCFNAVAKVFAKDNLETIKNWGVITGKDLMEKVYKTSYSRKDLKSSVQLYNRLFKLWFNFGNQTAEFLSDNEVNIIFEDFETDFKNLYLIATGWIEASFNLLIGKKVTTKFVAKSWEGDKETIINVVVS